MKLHDRTRRKTRTIQVDPKGFIPLTYEYGEVDLEWQFAKYNQLTNFANHLLKVRCNTIVYGGSDRTI